MPFESVQDGENMSITIASKKGTVLWKNNSDDETMPKKGGHIEVDELVSDSYDEECGEYIFVYTKSVEKMLYYIVFRTPAYCAGGGAVSDSGADIFKKQNQLHTVFIRCG